MEFFPMEAWFEEMVGSGNSDVGRVGNNMAFAV
jgi:hypothetical protein